MKTISTKLSTEFEIMHDIFANLILVLHKERAALEQRDVALLFAMSADKRALMQKLNETLYKVTTQQTLLSAIVGDDTVETMQSMTALLKRVGKNGPHLLARWNEIQDLVSAANILNKENERIAEQSHAFFTEYIRILKRMRHQAIGYSNTNKNESASISNVLINRIS